jgi:hypothetical protein
MSWVEFNDNYFCYFNDVLTKPAFIVLLLGDLVFKVYKSLDFLWNRVILFFNIAFELSSCSFLDIVNDSCLMCLFGILTFLGHAV